MAATRGGAWTLVDGKWSRGPPVERPPSSSTHREDGAVDAMSSHRGGVLRSAAAMNQTAAEHRKRDATNPFNPDYKPPQFDPQAADYGRPEKGSKTERRGIKAGNYVMREIIFLCEIIDKYGKPSAEEGQVEIKFGPLFDLYATYSDKVVGMLLRARKYSLVAFEGEMLYQRQDDHKIVTLLKPLAEIRRSLAPTNDPKQCIASS